ncbi:hypothetical protein E2C01_041549 [Portunus trituberculatus]|uniref:Uncharacterized protein n=1 Tax=Portunus trituberculatus TaxID=210409 RepID=A0A5B7FMW8_PORTR|nr:hypothetical protein [Portunus trituberculatus]
MALVFTGFSYHQYHPSSSSVLASPFTRISWKYESNKQQAAVHLATTTALPTPTAAPTRLTHELCKLLDYERKRSRCRRKCDQVQLKTMDRRGVLDQLGWSQVELLAEPGGS